MGRLINYQFAVLGDFTGSVNGTIVPVDGNDAIDADLAAADVVHQVRSVRLN